MVEEVMPASLIEKLDKTVCYSWILQHPENRIVCAVRAPRLIVVAAHRIDADGTVHHIPRTDLAEFERPNMHTFPTWDAMRSRLLEWNERYQYNFQGFVFQELATGRRFKLRTPSYNEVRVLRDNTPRRDFIWLTQWKAQKLNQYLRVFPEEKYTAETIINRWKLITTDVFRLYTAKFKAKSFPEVPPKFKGILHSMQQHYFNILKPAGKTFTFPEAVEWMNQRDVPQMLYLINYELRAAMAVVEEIPYEAAVAAAAAGTPAAADAADAALLATPIIIHE